MNKILLLLLLAFSLTSFTASVELNEVDSIELVKRESGCKHRQCKATAKSTGNRCKHCVSKSGDIYCWQHK